MEKFDCERYDREGKFMHGEFVKVEDVISALAVERAFAIDAKEDRSAAVLMSLITELRG